MTHQSFTPPNADSLLRTAVRAVRSGNRPAAHAILRSLTRHYPEEVRGWMGLAELAISNEERIRALEQVVRLVPENERARQALDRLRPQTVSIEAPRVPRVRSETVTPHNRPVAPVLAPSIEEPAIEEPDEQFEAPRQRRGGWLWPIVATLLLLVAAVACLALLVPSWFSRVPSNTVRQPSAEGVASENEETVATGATATLGVPKATEAGNVPTSVVPAQPTAAQPTIAPDSQQPSVATSSATSGPTAAAATATTNVPQRVTSTPLAPGALLEIDNWRASLSRQDRLLMLDGAVGNQQPKGRFVLALISLANRSDQPRRLPSDLFLLIDDRGTSYRPVPALSTAYLAAYGRGLRGDLSMEDEMPAGGGYFSVPVLFDVPPDARGLRLSLGDGSVGGWNMTP